jgi:hypothetical protein
LIHVCQGINISTSNQQRKYKIQHTILL